MKNSIQHTRELAWTTRHFVCARWRWQHLRGATLTQFQEERAQAIVNYAARHAPFYRKHWAGHDLHNWRILPTVDKQLMMQNFATFNTRGIELEQALLVALRAEQERDFRPMLADLTVGLSSGTSGHRGLFLVSPSERAGWAGVMLARALHELRPRRLRVAFFLRSNSNLYEQIGGLLLQFRYFDLMLPLPAAVAQLNSFQPHIIVGPPSLLGMLAQARRCGALHIHPERLISVAEVLEPQDKGVLEEVFAVPVEQIYQCTEGLLAVSCAHGSLHIQEDLIVLQCEPLPDEHQTSHIQRVTPIVTDLWRKTQPIIRYRLNDVLRLDPRLCSCGSAFRVIQAIEGRCDDLCYFTQHSGEVRAFFPDTIRRMILLASAQITDYQVVQEHRDQLHIYLAVSEQAAFAQVAGQVRERVNAIVAQYDCRPAEVVIEEGLRPVTAGQKRRRVKRLR
jgi:putative adenylate-forming enzyme